MLLSLTPLLSESAGDITIRCSGGLSYQPVLTAQLVFKIRSQIQVTESSVVTVQSHELIRSTASTSRPIGVVTGALKETIKGASTMGLVPVVSAHIAETIRGTATAANGAKVLVGSLKETLRGVGAVTNSTLFNVHVAEAIRGSSTASYTESATGQLKERIGASASLTASSSQLLAVGSERIKGSAAASYARTIAGAGRLRIGGFCAPTYNWQVQGSLGLGVGAQTHSAYSVLASAHVGVEYRVRCSAELVAVTQLSSHLGYGIAGAGVLTQQTELQAHVQETIAGSAQLDVHGLRFYARRSGYPLYAQLTKSAICTVRTVGYILEVTCTAYEDWVDVTDQDMRKVVVKKNKRAKVDATANAKTTVKTKAVRTHKVVTKPHVNWVVVENKNG